MRRCQCTVRLVEDRIEGQRRGILHGLAGLSYNSGSLSGTAIVRLRCRASGAPHLGFHDPSANSMRLRVRGHERAVRARSGARRVRVADHSRGPGFLMAVSTRRSFLFLQGPASPFFPRLADALLDDGHAIDRINFTAGDALFWGRRRSLRFDDDFAGLESFLEGCCVSLGFTDLVLFGDHQPAHQTALLVARKLGIRSLVFEQGYFQPHWITLEAGGVNGHSPLPRDPKWYREVGPRISPIAPQSFAEPTWTRAAYDVAYHLANATNPLFFSHYRDAARVGALREYAGYARRLPMLPFARRSADARLARLLGGRAPIFLVLMQRNDDARVRDHSPYADMPAFLEAVLESFAHHAPPTARLVIKNHPLDPGHTPYARLIQTQARRWAVHTRVQFHEDCDLRMLYEQAQGVVTVNSSAALTALAHVRPTIALGRAPYNIPGLTFQDGLDEFWCHAAPPETQLFRYFRSVATACSQVNGGYFSSAGIRLAVANCAAVLSQERLPLEEFL